MSHYLDDGTGAAGPSFIRLLRVPLHARVASTNAPPAPVPANPAPVAAPFDPLITATKVDSFPDVDGDGKAEPGETITYDVNVTNNGTDATGVNFTGHNRSNTTLVGGSLKVSPLAFADSFVAAQNTPLSVGAPGVLTNDTGIPRLPRLLSPAAQLRKAARLP